MQRMESVADMEIEVGKKKGGGEKGEMEVEKV